MAGRPKTLKITPVRFTASRDGESKVFTSSREALQFIAGGKKNVRVEPTYFMARGWRLEMERVPLAGEEMLDEESYSGKRFFEAPFVIKGSTEAELRHRAEEIRRASFQKHWLFLGNPVFRAQLPPASRIEAKLAHETHYETVIDPIVERAEARRAAEEEQKRKEAKDAAIPTVMKTFEDDLDRRILQGHLQANSADTCRYEAASFRVEVPVNGQMTPFADLKISQVTSGLIRSWFNAYCARENKFGKLPSAKTAKHVLLHVASIRKALRRTDEYKAYAPAFDVVEELLEDAKRIKRDSDGWRKRHRLFNEEVLLVLEACKTEVEKAALALALAGGRPPSELAAAEWRHFALDDAGNLWWHVEASAIERKGQLLLRGHTKTIGADYRELNICRALAPWIENRRGKSNFVLGNQDKAISPADLVDLIEGVLERAKVLRPGVSSYSLRHTVGDEVERILGRTARDLVLHAKRDRTTAGMHYSHAERDRRRVELTFDGKPYGEHMAWARNSATKQ